MLDISKAQDRLNCCKLLLKLISCGVPVDVIMLLQYWFKGLFAVVLGKGKISDQFHILSDVRQGGVSSSWFFNLYIIDLTIFLELSDLGCYLSDIFVGCILYADNILLMSESVI